ncbi:hypothetical protein ALC62_13857, partial [Cyphomyrmex costatus]
CVIACGCVSVIDNGEKEGNHIVKPNNILQQKKKEEPRRTLSSSSENNVLKNKKVYLNYLYQKKIHVIYFLIYSDTYGGIHISRAFIIRICKHANNTYQNSFDCVNW